MFGTIFLAVLLGIISAIIFFSGLLFLLSMIIEATDEDNSKKFCILFKDNNKMNKKSPQIK